MSINYGEWIIILKFLEEKANAGTYLVCNCSECCEGGGTYVHHKAYVNRDGDFVLSRDTLCALVHAAAYEKLLDFYSKNNRYLDPSKVEDDKEIIERLYNRR